MGFVAGDLIQSVVGEKNQSGSSVSVHRKERESEKERKRKEKEKERSKQQKSRVFYSSILFPASILVGVSDT